MSKTLKYGLLISGIIIISLIGFVGFGLYTLEIEDHYGDYQELFYESKNGDIIVNKTTSEFGIIEKNWKRINIRTQNKDSKDLYFWIYQNGLENKTEVYRPKKGKIELNEITYSDLIKKIEESKLKLIARK